MPEEHEKELRKLYERYKLQWMIYHDFSLVDLIKELEVMIQEDAEFEDIRQSLQERFEAWEFGIGFGGQIWPCFDEFVESDLKYLEPKTVDWSDHSA